MAAQGGFACNVLMELGPKTAMGLEVLKHHGMSPVGVRKAKEIVMEARRKACSIAEMGKIVTAAMDGQLINQSWKIEVTRTPTKTSVWVRDADPPYFYVYARPFYLLAVGVGLDSNVQPRHVLMFRSVNAVQVPGAAGMPQTTVTVMDYDQYFSAGGTNTISSPMPPMDITPFFQQPDE